MTNAYTNAIAKIAAVVAALALVAMSFVSFAPANAADTFTRDLTVGSSGADVTALQTWLISKGQSIPAGATGYFGAQTQAALAAWQAANGVAPAAGYFGPITRAKVNMAGGSTTGGGSTSSGDLEGGAGSVSSYDLMSGFSNEEVGEDEEDVEVAGLEIEVDDGSDLEITAVRVSFTQNSASEDFEDYAEEVSFWLDGEEVGRVDADGFDDNNDFTKTVSLDGAVIKADDTGELTVAVSGISNLDSADAGDTWDLDFEQVRFEDAEGAIISEDPQTGVETFEFQTFASAVDAELKVSLTNDEDAINEAHVIDTDDNDDTDNVEILAFTLEAEGDSDLIIDELDVNFDSTVVNLENMVTDVKLLMDGEEVGSENMTGGAGTDETITFEDLDMTIDAGEEVEFTVEVTIVDGVTNGATLSATIGATERTAMDVEDESGENMTNRSGTAVGEAAELRQSGIMLKLVSVDADVTTEGDAQAPTSDKGTFVITFDVTAFDTDAYVDNSAPLAAGSQRRPEPRKINSLKA